jgi:nucleotide-binding universal stress UspA family protein
MVYRNNKKTRRILAAVDGSVHSLNAFERALELAKGQDAELLIVHVIPDTRTGGLVEYGTRYGSMAIVHAYYRSAEKEALEWLKPLEDRARQQQVKAKSEILWELGKSHIEMIIEYAKKNSIDLIVMGTRGRGAFKRLLLGSVASGVVSHAPCSVMVVR